MTLRTDALLIAFAVLFGVGGGGGVVVLQARALEDAPRPGSTPGTDAEIRYLADVRDRALQVGNADDEQLLATGQAVCHAIRLGQPAAYAATTRGYDLTVIVSAATRSLCPTTNPLAGTR